MRYTHTLFLILTCITLLHFVSCYGVNEKSSEIAVINTDCLKDSTWSIIKKRYNYDTVTVESYLYAIKELKSYLLSTDILYFDSGPRELIAVSTDHYTIRYQNSNTSFLTEYKILHGQSAEMTPNERIRIRNRILSIIMEFQCEEGRKTSLKQMAEKIE